MIVKTGSDLRKVRLEFKKTQKQIGELFGVCRSTYSSWESKYKEKSLPKKVIKRFPDIGICMCCNEFTKDIKGIIERVKKLKKESILKRILKWIMRKN